MRFKNFFMIDKEENNEHSLNSILSNIHILNKEWDKEDHIFSKKIILLSMAYYMNLANIITYALHYFNFHNNILANYVAATFIGGILGFFVSIIILINISTFKLPFSDKLSKINDKLQDTRSLIIKLLKTQQFQKELINSLSMLEKSSYIDNQNQIYIKKMKLNIAEELQNNQFSNVITIIENNTEFLFELLTNQESIELQEKSVENYLKKIEEDSDIGDNNTNHAYASKGSIDYRKMI